MDGLLERKKKVLNGMESDGETNIWLQTSRSGPPRCGEPQAFTFIHAFILDPENTKKKMPCGNLPTSVVSTLANLQHQLDKGNRKKKREKNTNGGWVWTLQSNLASENTLTEAQVSLVTLSRLACVLAQTSLYLAFRIYSSLQLVSITQSQIDRDLSKVKLIDQIKKTFGAKRYFASGEKTKG